VETWQHELESYRHLDLEGWISVYRVLPVWSGLVLTVIGALMIFFGGGRLFRVVAVPLGAAIGLVWAGALATRFGYESIQKPIVIGTSVALSFLGLVFPTAVLFIALGAPCGLLGGQLAGSTDYIFGFLPGFFVGGAFAVLFERHLSGIISSLFGAWLFTLGLCCILSPVTSAVDSIAKTPLLILAFAGVCALIGIVYQVFIRPAPEVREKQKQEKFMNKKMKKERQALEARWTKKK